MIAQNPERPSTGFVRNVGVQTSPQEQLSGNCGFASSISLSFPKPDFHLLVPAGWSGLRKTHVTPQSCGP